MNVNIAKFKIPQWLYFILIGAETLLMVFFVTISIIAMNTVGQAPANPFMEWIKWLTLNPIWMFVIVVLPIILLFLFNAYLLVKAFLDIKPKTMDTAGMTEEQIREEAKKQAREELLKEMENSKNSKQ